MSGGRDGVLMGVIGLEAPLEVDHVRDPKLGSCSGGGVVGLPSIDRRRLHEEA